MGGARRMNLESARLATTALCVVALAVALAAGVTSLLLSRAIDRRRDTSLAALLVQVRDQLLMDRPQRANVSLPPPLRLPSPTPPARLQTPAPPAQISPPIAPAAPAIRVIAPDQRDRMVRILALAPADILITSDGDREAEAFAEQVAGVFRDAGWQVQRSLFVGLRDLPPLAADLPQTPRDVAVRAAFAAAGYPLPTYENGSPANPREILIGALTPRPLASAGPGAGG
jgi:hypothetical protein